MIHKFQHFKIRFLETFGELANKILNFLDFIIIIILIMAKMVKVSR
jgi:hypothetical protein